MGNLNNEQKPLLAPDVISRIELLKLTARHVAEGVLTGLHRSKHRGASLEFAEHKPYSAGDDVRLIDWKVYAKSDRYTIKQFEDETNVNAVMVLDTSASMGYGSVGVDKLFYGAQLLASLGYLLVRQRDVVGLALLSENKVSYLPPRSRFSHLNVMVEQLARLKPVGTSKLADNLTRLAEKISRKAMIFIASDFFESPDETMGAVKMLSRMRHEVTVFHLWDPEELRFPFDHQTQFEDMEGPLKIAVDPRGIRKEYLRQVQLFIENWKNVCLEKSVDYVQVNIAESPADVLHRYLASRMKSRAKVYLTPPSKGIGG